MEFRRQRKGETNKYYKRLVLEKIKRSYRKGELTPEEIKACEAKGIDLERTLIPKTFEERLEELQEFRDKHKRNPSTYVENIQEISLSKWRYSAGKKRLKELGIYTYGKTLAELNFDKRLKELKDFVDTNNRLPSSLSKDKKEKSLANWRSGAGRDKLREVGFYNYGRSRIEIIFDDRLEELKCFREIKSRNPKQNSLDLAEATIAKWRYGNSTELMKLNLYDYGETRYEIIFEKRLNEFIKFRLEHKRNPLATSKSRVERSLSGWIRNAGNKRLKELGIYKYKKED